MLPPLALALLLLQLLLTQGHASSTGRNVLLVIVDDLRPEIGSYGQKHMKTPHLASPPPRCCSTEPVSSRANPPLLVTSGPIFNQRAAEPTSSGSFEIYRRSNRPEFSSSASFCFDRWLCGSRHAVCGLLPEPVVVPHRVMLRKDR